jgi:membrane-associated phospholipid phosphatase
MKLAPGVPILVVAGLIGACALVMAAELAGVRTSVHLELKGDVARDSRWAAQYGQFTCVIVAAALVWQFESRQRRGRAVATLLIAVIASALLGSAIKHSTGRLRPAYASAPTATRQFTGPFLSRDSHRESFPSSHTAAAFACSLVLSRLYPRGRYIFWLLAIACGALRWIDEAHWLSDVLAGAALGYIVGHLVERFIGLRS